MPIDDAGHGVEVNIGECRCPGTPRPHPDGDIVTLVPRLTLPMAASLRARMMSDDTSGDAGIAAVQYSLVSGYLRKAPFGGIESWTLLEEGPVVDRRTGTVPLISVPITLENVERLIPWGNGGEEVAEMADLLYGADFLAPFLRRINSSSSTGPTDDSTSAKRRSGRSPRSPSRPSLRPVSGGRQSA